MTEATIVATTPMAAIINLMIGKQLDNSVRNAIIALKIIWRIDSN